VVPHAHDANDAIQSAEESAKDGTRAAWISLILMMLTAGAQVVIVAISGSIALLADTVHNLGHLATTIPLIIAFRIGSRIASKRYPYGYRRIEDLVGVFIGLVILISIAYIIYEAIDAVVNPRPLTNLWWVFAAGVVGFIGNEIVAIYRIRAGRRIGSAALIAEGQHARADGLTSVAVVIGVLGVWAGFQWADAAIGFVIALMILGILIASMKPVFRRLLDGVEDGVIDKLTNAAASVEGVEGVDRVRARWTGHRMEGDVAIRVSEELDVVRAHEVADRVEHEMMHVIPNMDAVIVHLHPVNAGDDALHELSGHHASADARRRYRERHGIPQDA
jgi:cation diffusion facilitator family transporter